MKKKVTYDAGYRDFYDKKEKEHWDLLEKAIQKADIPLNEVMKNYAAYIRRRDMPRLLAHYELFRMVENLPGSIVELGVFLGAGLFTFAKLLETFVPGDRSRKVYGFDNFKGYPDFTEKDGQALPWVKKLIGNKKSKLSYIEDMVRLHNNDNLIPGVERVKIIPGDIKDTVPEFVKSSLGMRISLLYFDVNIYEPTKVGLEFLYPLVIPGGVVAFNAYGAPPWEGEANAIEEYFSNLGRQPVMNKFSFSTHPSAYFIKE
ncbi:TylF/MycF/NovP-related O-methyltransferase [Fibrobacterota bacterium]